MNKAKLRHFNIFEAPFISVKVKVVQPGTTNGVPNIKEIEKRTVAPSANKIARYIVNQIFGSDLVTQTEGLNINWLMPTLKETLREAVYSQESFIYIHKFDDKIYLENIKKCEIFDLVQNWDKVISGRIIQEIDGIEDTYILERQFQIENGKTYLIFKAYIEDKDKKQKEISIDLFNIRTGNNYESKYILPYEAIINIDIGERFFDNSEKELKEEMRIMNIIADELQKTRTRIVSSQHYQSGDITTKWIPGNTNYKIDSLSVGDMQDYFTLLPGDRDHQFFQFLQGDIRTKEYVETFKFYDFQIIQNAGLSPASFGYETNAYMNVANVELSKDSSEMSIEAIKTQIEPQIEKLLQNIAKAQQSANIQVNKLPEELIWTFGNNEFLKDDDKINLLKKILNTVSLPYQARIEIILPILKKLMSGEYSKTLDIEKLLEEHNKEQEKISIKYGEI